MLFVPPKGVSVISDIDDTIKVTEVLDRRRMLYNTFLREFKDVTGMVAVELSVLKAITIASRIAPTSGIGRTQLPIPMRIR